MEEMKAAIIPTRSKAKISHALSFPIGAERVSVALASAVQFPQLVLDFRSDYFNTVRSGRYPFLRVMNSCAEKPIARPFSSGVPTLSEWSIAVWPVLRVFRHRVQRYILDSALTQIKQ
jgi:hypothetical protein